MRLFCGPWFDGSPFQGCAVGSAGVAAHGQCCSSLNLGSHRQLPAAAAAGGREGPGGADCPLGLLGAFHEGKQALLMCGNNLPDDPALVWVVLAHESAHVMQSCHGGNLMPAALLSREVELARQQEPNPFHELQLYHSSQHHVEAEARLIQALPAQQVMALFEQHCAQRLSP